MNKGIVNFRAWLGVFNILWFLALSFMSLASQFQLIFYLFLGVVYLNLAKGLFRQSIWVKKFFIFVIIPLSILAILNIIIMGTSLVAPYFRMTLMSQIGFTIIFVGIPLVLNALYIMKQHKKET